MSIYEKPRFISAGESCLVVEFADEIDGRANERVHALRSGLERMAKIRGLLVECVPTYRSLAVYFDATRLALEELEQYAGRVLAGGGAFLERSSRVVEIPVRYGADDGPDLPEIARIAGMSEEEVIARHSGRDYYCYMLGFTPGFPYLGGMDPKIAAPRLATPRTKIPAGSVGIAGEQTGVYPLDSPGGWQLIGRTDARLFDPDRNPPTLIAAGDTVRFVPVQNGREKS